MLFLTSNVGLENMEGVVKYWREFLIELNRTHSQSVGKYQPLLEQLYKQLTVYARYTVEECEDLNTQSEERLEKMYEEFEVKEKYRNSIDEIYDLLGELITYDRCVELGLMMIYELDVREKEFWGKLESLLLPLVDTVDEITTPTQPLT